MDQRLAGQARAFGHAFGGRFEPLLLVIHHGREVRGTFSTSIWQVVQAQNPPQAWQIGRSFLRARFRMLSPDSASRVLLEGRNLIWGIWGSSLALS